MNKEYKFDKSSGGGFVSSHGITLISLVITIVVLIILASVGIYLGLSNNGIFIRAKQAKEATNKQTATEKINLKITNCQMNKYAEEQRMPTLQELADILYEDNEIQYVALETKVGSKEKIIVGEKTSIFTKLNQYPYEFEINSSLQLASINGVKVAINSKNEAKLEKKVVAEFNYDPRNDNNNQPYYGVKTFDVKEIIPNYNKLTKENFCLQANSSRIVGTDDTTTPSEGCADFKIVSYEDGILTIELTKGVRNKWVAYISFSIIAFYID